MKKKNKKRSLNYGELYVGVVMVLTMIFLIGMPIAQKVFLTESMNKHDGFPWKVLVFSPIILGILLLSMFVIRLIEVKKIEVKNNETQN